MGSSVFNSTDESDRSRVQDIAITEGDITLTDGDITITKGDLTVTEGDTVLTAGSFTVAAGDVSMAGSGKDITIAAANGKVGFFGATALAQTDAYTLTNETAASRSLSGTESSAGNIAVVVTSLIRDLINLGILKHS